MTTIDILIVEDQALVAKELKSTLLELGYNVVSICCSSIEAIDICNKNNINIVLMDIYIKGDIDGIDTAKNIQEIQKNISIIYTTALSDEETIKKAIETKPSSYLVKPIKLQELSIALQIAKTKFDIDKNLSDDEIYIGDNFVFNTLTNQLKNKGVDTPLTKKETQLLAQLINSKNSLVSFYEIENDIWPDKSVSQSTIRSLVSRLKAKLNHKFISNVSQFGYKLEVN